MKQRNWLKTLSCSVFAGLYLIVAVISLICSTEFFKLAHSGIMSWVLAIGFEIGAMSCLLSTLILPKKKLGLVWFMFVVLTLFQCMGNMYAAFVHLENFQDWIDMFGMTDMELLAQKRVLAGISGVILPLVALGFIRIMADVLQDGHDIEINDSNETQEQPVLFGQKTEDEMIEEPIAEKEPEKNLTVEEPVIEKEPEENIDIENTKEQENRLAKGISGTSGPIESFNKTAKQEQETIEKEPEKNQILEEPVIEKEPEKNQEEKAAPKPEQKHHDKPKAKPAGRIWNPSINAELG